MQQRKGFKQAVLVAAVLGIGLTSLVPVAKADDDHGNKRYRKVYYAPTTIYRPVVAKPVYVYRPPVVYKPVYRPVTVYKPVAGYRVLPAGYKRVVIRGRTFYTPNNRTFLAFSPSRGLYVNVNPFTLF
ncbi:MAG TPA: hypothetical protein V6D19_24800 [Stenomitos sp.]